MPTISPARTARETLRSSSGSSRSCASSATSSVGVGNGGNSWPTSRPTIRGTIMASVAPAAAIVRTSPPSLRTVTVSAIRSTSRNRCVMYRTAMPFSRSRPISEKRFSASSLVSAAVGSSRIRSRALTESAFAIATSSARRAEATRADGVGRRPGGSDRGKSGQTPARAASRSRQSGWFRDRGRCSRRPSTAGRALAPGRSWRSPPASRRKVS